MDDKEKIKDIILGDLSTIDAIVRNEDISLPLLNAIMTDVTSYLYCIKRCLNEEKETNKE